MKKLIIILFCLMTMATNANAQNIAALKQGAVNYIRQNCKAPSTFILTNKLGIKISAQAIKCEVIKQHEIYDSVDVKGITIDSIIVCKHNLGEDPFSYRANRSHTVEDLFIAYQNREKNIEHLDLVYGYYKLKE